MGNHHAEEDLERYEAERAKQTCKHCAGLIVIHNPRGDCNHLYWPDNLTEEAKIANGYRKVVKTIIEWVR